MVDGRQDKPMQDFPVRRGANQEPSRRYLEPVCWSPYPGHAGVSTAWKLAVLQIRVLFFLEGWFWSLYQHTTPRPGFTLRAAWWIPNNHDDIIVYMLWDIVLPAVWPREASDTVGKGQNLETEDLPFRFFYGFSEPQLQLLIINGGNSFYPAGLT